jgi:shikimate kinase
MEMRNHNTIQHKSPLIVELIGLAGAGKTTLAQALSQRDEKIQVAADIKLRKKEHLLLFTGYVPFLLPVFLRRSRSSRWFTWDEIKAMVYLRGWPRVLRQQASTSGPVILLDHGPVFKLATLSAFGPERLKSPGFEPWWDNMFKQWADTLDIVIRLDAPERVLVERINARNQRHAVKGSSELEAQKFLRRYQMSYEQILAKLTAQGKPRLFHFDTDRASTEQIVEEVLVTCNLNRAATEVENVEIKPHASIYPH